MSAVTEAAAELAGALRSIEGVRVYDLGQSVDPPGIVIGPPRLEWAAYSTEITSASFPVYLVAALGDRTLEQLTELAPKVAAVIEQLTDASIDSADPTIYPVGELPAYLFIAEFPLT